MDSLIFLGLYFSGCSVVLFIKKYCSYPFLFALFHLPSVAKDRILDMS